MNVNNKRYNLSIETTSKICGIALSFKNNIIYSDNSNSCLNHSVALFEKITKLINNLNINFKQIDKIFVSSGPGSFTGIRIGIATAIGLSKTYNTKVEYIDTLDSLAYNVKNKCDYILSMIDAKSNRVYFALYESKSLKKVFNDIIVPIDNLYNLLNKYFSKKNIRFAFVGDGATNYRNEFESKLCINFTIYDKESNLEAKSLLFLSGNQSYTPIINYLIPSKAEREYNAKH